MAKKQFSYRGKTLEELQKLSIKELAELLPARQRRTLTRGLDETKLDIIKKLSKKDSIKTQSRDMIVLPAFVGKTVKIHDGKNYVPIIMQEEMIGMFFGELAMTRKKVQHNAPGVGSTKSSSNVAVK